MKESQGADVETLNRSKSRGVAEELMAFESLMRDIRLDSLV